MIDKDPIGFRRVRAARHLDGQRLGLQSLEFGEGGIRDADAIISVSSSDEVNLLACSLAAQLECPGEPLVSETMSSLSHSTVNLDALRLHVIDPEQAIVRVIEQNNGFRRPSKCSIITRVKS